MVCFCLYSLRECRTPYKRKAYILQYVRYARRRSYLTKTGEASKRTSGISTKRNSYFNIGSFIISSSTNDTFSGTLGHINILDLAENTASRDVISTHIAEKRTTSRDSAGISHLPTRSRSNESTRGIHIIHLSRITLRESNEIRSSSGDLSHYTTNGGHFLLYLSFRKKTARDPLTTSPVNLFSIIFTLKIK
jgi:hypothetical protein